jgi:hypothetical protein
VWEPLLQAFPFPSTGKGDTALRCQACLFIYSSCGRWVFPPLLCSFPPTATFTCFPAPSYWAVLLLLPPAMFVNSSHGKWVFPPLTSFPAPGCWARALLPPEALHPPGLFIYSPGKDSLHPIFSDHGALPSFQCVLIVLIAYYSVSLFFPGGGQSVQGAMLLWPRLVCGGTAVLRSSPGLCLPKPYGRRPLAALVALLISPFNVKWRFSAPAGDVEESKLCLFSVIMPAKCVSSVSPRFHYRRVAFCFLPLAAILFSLRIFNYIKTWCFDMRLHTS